VCVREAQMCGFLTEFLTHLWWATEG